MKRSAWSGIVGAGELAAVDRCSGSVWRLCNWVVSIKTWETRAWIARLETVPCSSWWSMRELLRDKKSLNSDALAGSILVRSFCHGTESSRSNCEWKQNLYLEHSKYSGCEEINGRAGADLSAVQVQISSAVQVQWARQSRVYSPGREYSPDPSGNLQKRDQARTASGPGRLTQRINETPAKQRSDNASQKRQPDIGSADELHL